MNNAQEVMDKIDPTIRIEVVYGAEGLYISTFDTTATPNHVREWIVPLIPYEEFIGTWVFTEGQAQT